MAKVVDANRWFYFGLTDADGKRTGKKVYVRADQIVAVQEDKSEEIENLVILDNGVIFKLSGVGVEAIVSRLINPERNE